MDLRSAEKINGKLLMKIGTLACFLLAGALLITSLFVPPPAQVGLQQHRRPPRAPVRVRVADGPSVLGKTMRDLLKEKGIPT